MSESTKSKKNDVLDMKNRIKVRIISNFKQKKTYFQSKSNSISFNLNYSNIYCFYSLKAKIYSVQNYLLFPFFMLFFLLIITPKNLNTMLYNHI